MKELTEPSFTIVVPTFNRAPFVKKQLDKLLSSNIHLNNEILVINDGSKDKTAEVLSQFNHFQNFKIINHKENLGLSRNMSFAIRNCKTEYLIWLTDDDIYHFDIFKKFKKILSTEKYDSIIPHFQSVEGIRDVKKSRVLTIFDVWKYSKHASGLILKTETVVNYLCFLEERLSKECIVAHFFPQFVLLINMALDDKLLFASSIEVGKQPKNVQNTNLLDKNGNHYLSLYNVIQRYSGFRYFFEDLKSRGKSKEVQIIKELQGLSLFSQFYLGLKLNSDIDPNKFEASSILSNLNPKKIIKAIVMLSKLRIRIFLSKYF